MRYNRKSIVIITAPAALAVSVADMKTYLRIDTSDDDQLIEDFIVAATSSVREYVKRALITETLEMTMDGFSCGEEDDRLLAMGAGIHTGSKNYFLGNPDNIELMFPPIQSITSIKTFDVANTESTFSSGSYQADEQGGRIYLNQGVVWPANLRRYEAVKIRYVAGYGNASTDIPAPITMAIKMHVARMYECREVCELADICKKMLAPYRLLDGLGGY